MSHRNARLTVHGGRLLVERVRSGRPVAHVAGEMGISRVDQVLWRSDRAPGRARRAWTAFLPDGGAARPEADRSIG
ncbi:leucine zipper domain-containing protein [Streptomyces gilvifuscus]|uniref:Leucine zipper domain-containing protein n=1 Tax=Streptomyces gilvifuscus TaxID=1550617 RepID=A0ABT5G9E1_9ACTN|nr:leucine zipper domain-containing protein [Streptomyces gilvifuscus]MDC2961476.1 leucine zipper domain-containing protein [Streptomyces gilvifuscus]